MRASEIITEGLSKVIYHYTSVNSAATILESGNFELTSSIGSAVEFQYAPKGYPYYISTTRSRRGGFHSNSGRYASSGVLFVLDGEWYSRHYKAKPIDYWQDRDPKHSAQRASEAEDRIFSKSPTMSIKGVTAVHVFVTDDADQAVIKAKTRSIMVLAKKQDIPVYFYDTFVDWVNFNKKKPGNISKLTGQHPVRSYYTSVSRHKGYLAPWMELINATSKSQLSSKARTILGSLDYDYNKENETRSLSNDFDSARRPTTAFTKDRQYVIKIIKFMQQNKIENIRQLVDYIAEKWKNIS